jgi:hypothetical protein
MTDSGDALSAGPNALGCCVVEDASGRRTCIDGVTKFNCQNVMNGQWGEAGHCVGEECVTP